MGSGALFEYYWRSKGAAAPFIAPVEVFGPASSKFSSTNRVLFMFITAGDSGDYVYRDQPNQTLVGSLHTDTNAELAGADLTINRMRIQNSNTKLTFNKTGADGFNTFFEPPGIYVDSTMKFTTETASVTLTLPDDLDDAGGGFLRIDIPAASRTFFGAIQDGTEFGCEIFDTNP